MVSMVEEHSKMFFWDEEHFILCSTIIALGNTFILFSSASGTFFVLCSAISASGTFLYYVPAFFF